jgi:membrane-associated phospholipid phosphatase
MTLVQASSARNTIRRRFARRSDVAAFVGAVLLPLGIFVALAATVAGEGALGWDAAILDLVDRYYRWPIAEPLGSALEAGRALAAALLVGALILLLMKGKRREALFCTLAVTGVLALDVPLKEIFRRPPWSPPGEDAGGAGYTFPSGHAMGSMALFAAITLVSARRWARWLLVVGLPLVVAIGIVLVYSWWHYPSDVLGGWCLALAWVTALWLAIRPGPGAVR